MHPSINPILQSLFFLAPVIPRVELETVKNGVDSLKRWHSIYIEISPQMPISVHEFERMNNDNQLHHYYSMDSLLLIL